MKRQLDKKTSKIIHTTFFLLVFFTLHSCKKPKGENFFPSSNTEWEYFEFHFLQIPNKEWKRRNIQIQEISLKKNYIKVGIPTNDTPTFTSEGCFYFLDPFYFYNEFGFTFKYCHHEIKLNYQRFNSFLEEIDNIYLETVSTNIISISTTTMNKLKQEKYIMIYNTFLKENFHQNIQNFTAHQYYYTNIYLNKNHPREIFLPKRFYHTQYALLVSNDSVSFIYEIKDKLIQITFKNKTLVDEIIHFFKLIEEVLNDFPTRNHFSIDMLYFDFKKLQQIRITSNEHYILIHNPKNQMNIFMFPYSYIPLHLNDFDYDLKDNNLTIYLDEPITIPLHTTSKIYNHWMIQKNHMYVPLELCLWNPCDIKDLDYEEFFEKNNSYNLCSLEDFTQTEINPFGLYSDNNISSYGKYIELKSKKDCENTYSKIYLSFREILIPLPDQIQPILYLFTATEKYYVYHNKIINSKIQSYSIKDSIKLIRFFPYEEKILFNGINDTNPYFIFGDFKNQIFRKIHSLVVLSENEWQFHHNECIGLKECNEYAMSPGYDNPMNSNNKQCEITELYIGGPRKNTNERITTDEFIELKCDKDHPYNKNILEVQYNHTSKKYYFPTPQYHRFVFLHDEPVCIKPEQYLVYKDIIIPNSVSTYQINQQNISIGIYEIKKYINTEIPVSLNYIQNYNFLLPSNHKATLESCKGFATPSKENQFIPYLYTSDYNDKNYVLISSDAINHIEIFHKENEKLLETSLRTGEVLFLNSHHLSSSVPHERNLIKIVIDSLYIQYDEVFNLHPLCFIDTIQIQEPEYLRICFLENSHFNLKLKDNISEIHIVPYHQRVSSYNHNGYLMNLEKNYYKILKHHCLILIPPNINFENIEILSPPISFTDSFLVTSNTNKIGNGLGTKEYIEIFTYVDNRKVSLCSYGIPEERLYLFDNTNKITLRHLSNWGFPQYHGLLNFNSY